MVSAARIPATTLGALAALLVTSYAAPRKTADPSACAVAA